MDNRTKKFMLIIAALLIVMFIIRSMGPTDAVTPIWQTFANMNSGEQETETPSTLSEAEGEEKEASGETEEASYTFRTPELRLSHFTKHGIDMGFTTEEAYEAVTNPNALHKTEAADGDDVYYIEDTNEFVVLSTDGYIRTYFNPDNGKAYFDEQ